MQKYAELKARVAGLAGVQLVVPDAASQAQLETAHQPDYVMRVLSGTLTPGEVREIGFPWSPEMVERSRRSVGATIEAARHACHAKVAVNLAGGTHHALAGRGSGFCVFNDVAVAVHVLRQERLALHPLVIDLDVHQGNGTASIFAADPLVFTLSLHGQKNFPFRKESSDLDVDLPDGTGDDDYLAALLRSLERVLETFTPDFIFYLAGADPHEGDRLGRLKLTHQGLLRRDQLVFQFAERLDVPVVTAMAGGYGRVVEDTVTAHLHTVQCALDSYRARCARVAA